MNIFLIIFFSFHQYDWWFWWIFNKFSWLMIVCHKSLTKIILVINRVLCRTIFNELLLSKSSHSHHHLMILKNNMKFNVPIHDWFNQIVMANHEQFSQTMANILKNIGNITMKIISNDLFKMNKKCELRFDFLFVHRIVQDWRGFFSL